MTLTHHDQIEVIHLVAQSTAGLDEFILVYLATFVAFLVLALLGEAINLNLRSKASAAFVNDNTSQEDTMANAKNQDSKDNKPTSAEVSEVTLRDRAHDAVDGAFDAVEAAASVIKSSWISFTTLVNNKLEQSVDVINRSYNWSIDTFIVNPMEFCSVKIQEAGKELQDSRDKAEAARLKREEEEALNHPVVKAVLARMDRMEAHLEKLHNQLDDVEMKVDPTMVPKSLHFEEPKVRFFAVTQIPGGSSNPRWSFVGRDYNRDHCLTWQELTPAKWEELCEDHFLHSNSPVSEPVFVNPVVVPEAMTLELRAVVEELLKEADALRAQEPVDALKMLRDHWMAKKYESIPKKQSFKVTRKAYLRLIS